MRFRSVLRPVAVSLLALAAGVWLTAPQGGTAAPSETKRGAAIDGSEDRDTSPTATKPSFAEIDAMGLRPKAPPTELIALKETADVVPVEKDGKPFKQVTFGKLASYKYTLPQPGELKRDATELPASFRGQIPARILELNEQNVAVTGFVIPLEVEKGKLKSFVLVRDQMMCCYGVIPQINEWVHVTTEEGYRAPFIQDVPVRVFGRLEVGEVLRRGQVMSVYRLKAMDLDQTVATH